MAKRSALANQHHLRLTSSPVPIMASGRAESPLHVRTRLRERRPVSVKRHTSRIETRLGVLLVADVGAIVVCALLARAATEQSVLGAWVSTEFARAVSGSYAGPVFGPLLFLSLVFTGCYSRHRSLNGKFRLLAAAGLACGFVLWKLVSGGDLLGALSVYMIAVTATWFVLLGVRGIAEKFLSKVWPGTRATSSSMTCHTPSESSTAWLLLMQNICNRCSRCMCGSIAEASQHAIPLKASHPTSEPAERNEVGTLGAR